jgi:spore germination cell wall hydrolase CwlJ-like protein
MGEARGASGKFQLGVANVIRNRASAVDGNYDAVINQAGAFSAMNDGDPNRAVVDATLENGTVTDEVRDIVEGVFTGTLSDNTDGALLYYSPQSMKPAGSQPGWNFGVLKKTLNLGNEGKFYKCNQGDSCWNKP